MLKKILFANAIMALMVNVALANFGAPYVGGGLGITTNTSADHNYRGVPFNLFGGYEVVFCDSFYIAGEVFVTLGTATISNHGLKSSYGYGASLLPGVSLSDHTLTFMRVGVIVSRFNSSKTQTGGQLGLGLQTSITQNVDLRGEYDFSAFGTFKHKGSSNGPRTDTFNVAVIYAFD